MLHRNDETPPFDGSMCTVYVCVFVVRWCDYANLWLIVKAHTWPMWKMCRYRNRIVRFCCRIHFSLSQRHGQRETPKEIPFSYGSILNVRRVILSLLVLLLFAVAVSFIYKIVCVTLAQSHHKTQREKASGGERERKNLIIHIAMSPPSSLCPPLSNA